MALRYSRTRHPGAGYTWVICDVCGMKVHRKDTSVVHDKYNTQNNLVVCRADRDKLNQQAVPIKIKERLVTAPQTLRPEPPDHYVTVENDDRVPSAPRNVQITPSSLSVGGLVITWDGPEDAGSSRITGYRIKRADPQLSGHEVIESNTQETYTSYADTTASLSQEYTYLVAAINGAGTGPDSAPGFYPYIIDADIRYLLVSQDSSVLSASDGTYIRLYPNL